MIRAASRFRNGAIHRRLAILPSVQVDQRREEQSAVRGAFPSITVIALHNQNGALPGRRHFSSGNKDSTSFESSNTISDTNNLSVDDTLNKIFEDSQQQLVEPASGDAWYAAAEHAATEWTPTWYNCADQAIVAITKMHEVSGLEYGWSIVATTVCLRLFLFPLMVQAQQAASRMAHVQPELQQMKMRYEKLGTPSRQEQILFSTQMKSLFARYNVKPSRTIIAPLAQLPMFVGMFFGLKKMPGIYPDEFSTGGMYWFTDLTVPDPQYILPVISAATFLGLIELGKEQMLLQSPGAQGQFMITFFRIMAVASLPICVGFEAAMLCYWTTNNAITMAQTALLKQTPVRKYFGIWDPPKPVPGQEPTDLVTSVSNLVKKVQGVAVTPEQKIVRHNQEVDAKKASFRMVRAARERRRKGITGTKNQ